MSRWAAIRRIAFAIVSAYLVISVVFGFVYLTDDPQEALIARGIALSGGSAEDVEEAIEEYRDERGRLDPWYVQYGRWLLGTATLDWGVSPTYGVAVTDLLAERLPYTALWVLPAMAIALVGGLTVGLLAALRRRTPVDRLATVTTYFGASLPNYWLAAVLPVLLVALGLRPSGGYGPVVVLDQAGGLSSLSAADAVAAALPSLVLASSLLAGQVQHARAEAVESLDEEFVKLLRARGASPWTVARHVARNAAIPLLSLFVADLLGVLVLNVFVLEIVFGIPGIGQLGFEAFDRRDLPILLGVTTIVVAVGIVGNLLQDFAAAGLDPRVDAVE